MNVMPSFIPLSRQLNFMQFKEKTIFYNKKNFYVKKLGAVRPWNKNEEFRFILIKEQCDSKNSNNRRAQASDKDMWIRITNKI